MIPDTALLKEASAASPQALNAILSAAGFNDISKDELLVLGVLVLNEHYRPNGARQGDNALERDLARQLGFAESAVRRHIGTLTRRGHLESAADQEGRDRAVPGITERGYRVIGTAVDGIPVARWIDLAFRPGDIVISTLPRSGTTWMQMICALLVFQVPQLPAPLQELSPWLEGLGYSRDELYAQLDAQQHRRFIKTHLPLHEIPVRPEVSYIVVARHPLDVAVSMYHYQPKPLQQPLREWLIDWFETERGNSPHSHRNSLPGMMQRMSWAWAHRAPNVLLVHYGDLCADLEGEMRRLAAHLGVTVPEACWPGLVNAATFDQMKSTGGQLVDDGVDPAAFFRKGTSGSGRELLSDAELARYHQRVAGLAPPDLLAWLHRDPLEDPCAATR